LATATTETQVILRALAANPEIQATSLDVKRDSLGVASLETRWLPHLSLEAQQRYLPYDSSALLGTRTRRLGSTGDASIIQYLPGGGTVAAGLNLGYSKDLRARTWDYTTDLQAGITQPLLSGAWNHGALQDTLKLRRFDQAQFTLEQRKRVLSAVSRIRDQYWRAVEQAHLESIYGRELEYAETMLDRDRNRFRGGNASELDTLTSSLERLQALESKLAASTRARLARNSLAVSLELPLDSIAVDTTLVIALVAPPAAEIILSSAERFDPELGIFKTLKERLQTEESRLKNQLLPRLDLGVVHSSAGVSGRGFFDNQAPLEANTILSLTLSYTIPMAETFLERKRASLAMKSTAVNEGGYRSGLRDRIEDLRSNWNQELEQLEVAEASKRVAYKKLQATQAGYRDGRLDRLTLQKAENEYLVSSVTLVQRQIGLKRLEVALDGIIGRFSGNMEIVWQ